MFYGNFIILLSFPSFNDLIMHSASIYIRSTILLNGFQEQGQG